MSEDNAKGAFIEKLIFALFPLIIAGIGYLLSAVSRLDQEVTILNQKTSLVVTTDNKQATNTGSELAREKLRQDMEKEIQHNKDMIMENRMRIVELETKLKGTK